MLNFDMKRKIQSLRDILVGKVPDPKAQVEQITIAMIYKFMDDIDLQGIESDFGGQRVFFKGEYEKYAWSLLMDSQNSGQQRFSLYAEGIDKMVHNPNLPQFFRDVFRGAYLPYRDVETLNMFLKEINDFSYNNSEDLGNAFEMLLSIMGSQGDAGQFRTPRHIIDMIVEIICPTKNDRILDPACGTAGFLISAYKYILKHNLDENGRSILNDSERNRLIENFCGHDISPDMVRLSRVNMYLHKFSNPNIYEYDTLTSLDKWNEQYDVILTNPPFMTPKGGIIPHNRYRIQAKRAELLFVDYIAEHLSTNGKAGIIVPDGIVFQSANAYKELREYITSSGNLLYAVISLPSGVFNPYSGVRTSILLFDKAIAKKTNKILFVKINNDGFDLGAQRREIQNNDIPRTIDIIKRFKMSVLKEEEFELSEEENEFACLVTIDEIRSQDYVLVGERYKKEVVYDIHYPMVELGEIVDIYNGSTPSKNDNSYWFGGTIPWFTVDDIRMQGRIINHTKQFVTEKALNETSLKLLPINTVLLCCTASVGEYALTKIPLTTNQQFNGLVVKTEKESILLPRYLFYMAHNFFSELERFGGQTSFQFVSVKNVKQIKIPLPSLKIQEQIVAEIDNYQKIIDGARQVVSSYKPTIKIDPSWEMVELGEVYNISYGLSISIPESESDNGIKIISTAELNLDGSLDLSKIRKITYNESYKKYILKPNTLLFNWRNAPKHVGKTALFTQRDDEYITASFILSLYLKSLKTIVDNRYVWYSINKLRESGYFLRNSRQAVNQTNFNGELLSKTKIPIPSLEVQKKIVEQIEIEQEAVEECKKLITIFENKIKNKINEVWRGDKVTSDIY